MGDTKALGEHLGQWKPELFQNDVWNSRVSEKDSYGRAACGTKSYLEKQLLELGDIRHASAGWQCTEAWLRKHQGELLSR